MGGPWHLRKLSGLEKVGGYGVRKSHLRIGSGNQQRNCVTTTLLKGTADGSKGPESQGCSWFGGDRIRSKIVEEKLGKK